MAVEQMIAFFVFAVVAAITPGPSNVMVLAAGARAGIAGGLPCLAGVVAGMAMVMGGATLGLGGVVQAFPETLVILKGVGSLFLLWLAWNVAISTAAPQGAGGSAVGFWGALLFQWVNPKSWIVCLSAAGTYGSAAGAGVSERALAMAGIFSLAAAPSCALWLVAGASSRRWLADPRRARVFAVFMGVAMALSVILVVS